LKCSSLHLFRFAT